MAITQDPTAPAPRPGDHAIPDRYLTDNDFVDAAYGVVGATHTREEIKRVYQQSNVDFLFGVSGVDNGYFGFTLNDAPNRHEAYERMKQVITNMVIASEGQSVPMKERVSGLFNDFNTVPDLEEWLQEPSGMAFLSFVGAGKRLEDQLGGALGKMLPTGPHIGNFIQSLGFKVRDDDTIDTLRRKAIAIRAKKSLNLTTGAPMFDDLLPWKESLNKGHPLSAITGMGNLSDMDYFMKELTGTIPLGTTDRIDVEGYDAPLGIGSTKGYSWWRWLPTTLVGRGLGFDWSMDRITDGAIMGSRLDKPFPAYRSVAQRNFNLPSLTLLFQNQAWEIGLQHFGHEYLQNGFAAEDVMRYGIRSLRNDPSTDVQHAPYIVWDSVKDWPGFAGWLNHGVGGSSLIVQDAAQQRELTEMFPENQREDMERGFLNWLTSTHISEAGSIRERDEIAQLQEERDNLQISPQYLIDEQGTPLSGLARVNRIEEIKDRYFEEGLMDQKGEQLSLYLRRLMNSDYGIAYIVNTDGTTSFMSMDPDSVDPFWQQHLAPEGWMERRRREYIQFVKDNNIADNDRELQEGWGFTPEQHESAEIAVATQQVFDEAFHVTRAQGPEDAYDPRNHLAESGGTPASQVSPILSGGEMISAVLPRVGEEGWQDMIALIWSGLESGKYIQSTAGPDSPEGFVNRLFFRRAGPQGLKFGDIMTAEDYHERGMTPSARAGVSFLTRDRLGELDPNLPTRGTPPRSIEEALEEQKITRDRVAFEGGPRGEAIRRELEERQTVANIPPGTDITFASPAGTGTTLFDESLLTWRYIGDAESRAGDRPGNEAMERQLFQALDDEGVLAPNGIKSYDAFQAQSIAIPPEIFDKIYGQMVERDFWRRDREEDLPIIIDPSEAKQMIIDMYGDVDSNPEIQELMKKIEETDLWKEEATWLTSPLRSGSAFYERAPDERGLSGRW